MPTLPSSQSEPEPPWRSAETAQPEKRIAVALCLILGFAGAHRFYLKRPWTGVCYLAFCWTLVPLVLALFDARSLSRMSDSDFRAHF